jgi:hypothetical protein
MRIAERGGITLDWSATHRESRTCCECGQPFRPLVPMHRACGPACRQARTRRLQARRDAALIPRGIDAARPGL